MNLKSIISIIAIFFVLISCNKENESKIYNVTGKAQKGPFRPGTNITISELDKTLRPTGLNYNTTVSDIDGSFAFPDVKFQSNYVEIIADGYYYNELNGKATEEKMVLRTIADLSNSATININTLTHISYERLKYLVQVENKTYNEAKIQTENEILSIFNFESNNLQDFELLDISNSSELNAKLLVISSIFQCYDRSISLSSLTELLSNFSFDIQKDGELNSDEIKSKLATSAMFLDVGTIRKNLSNFYNNDTIFNQFPKYVEIFNSNTDFEPYIEIEYSNSTEYGKNLLGIIDNSILQEDTPYYIGADNIPNNYYFIIYLGKTNETGGDIEFIPIDDGSYSFNTDNPYEGMDAYYELFVYPENGKFSINLSGTGEFKMIIYLTSEGIDNNFNYSFVKYFKW
ncbi:MAG: hypothetical protein GXO79_01695 [Chlorobi bacterium]|nr:hypothetical protein [Chlorobiota bacterium]